MGSSRPSPGHTKAGDRCSTVRAAPMTEGFAGSGHSPSRLNRDLKLGPSTKRPKRHECTWAGKGVLLDFTSVYAEPSSPSSVQLRPRRTRASSLKRPGHEMQLHQRPLQTLNRLALTAIQQRGAPGDGVGVCVKAVLHLAVAFTTNILSSKTDIGC